MRKIIIAIDGYSACGKSTTAKEVAKVLGFRYIDSGAMYRAVTLYFLEHHISLTHPKDVDKALEQIKISKLMDPVILEEEKRILAEAKQKIAIRNIFCPYCRTDH